MLREAKHPALQLTAGLVVFRNSGDCMQRNYPNRRSRWILRFAQNGNATAYEQ